MSRLWSAYRSALVSTCSLFCLFQTSCDSPQSITNFGTKDKPVELPSSDIAQLQGSAAFLENFSSGEIYNGTTWNVTDLDALVVAEKTNQSRRLRMNCVKTIQVRRDKWKEGDPVIRYEEWILKPYSNGEFRGSGADFLKDLTKEDVSWSIVGARGYKSQ